MDTANSKGVISFFNRLGPGLLLAATSIGASHLVMSPKAGAMFGFQLLWLVPLTHLFKYHAFEFGPRYAAATGESLIAGYARVPGPRCWALWILLLGTIAQGIGVLAGVAGIAAAVLFTFVGHLPLWFYSVLVVATVLLFLVLGGYGWMDFLNKIMMTVLFLATIAVFVPARPNPAEFRHFVIPSLPPGSIVLIAAILGWMPTGIDVSIWHSLWTLKKHRELASLENPARRWRIFRFSLMDMRIGYILSFVVGSVFLLLGAVYLHGTTDKIEGAGFAQSLAKIYTTNIGHWMYYVFMVAAFTAMYSTVYAVMDGFSRSFAETVSTIFPRTRAKWRTKLYWAFVLFTAAFALLILVAFKGDNPVGLVLDVAFLSLCVAPLYCVLNYYCVTRLIKDERFKPRAAARLVALAGIVAILVATVICACAKFKVFQGTGSQGHNALGISPSGHYITYKGEVLMLIGDSGTQCAAQNRNLDHRQWIDDCARRGIRAIHIWSFVPVRQKQDGSQIEERWGYVIPDVMPWARSAAGPPAHDQRRQWNLQAFDEGPAGDMTHYWPRMRDICSYARSKNVIVGVTMFTGWAKHEYSWVFHPLNVNNGGHLTRKEDAVIIASPGTEVWKEAWSDSWPDAKKTQWVWEQLSIKFINELGDMGNVFFVFLDEHSYPEGNMGNHFLDFFRRRGQVWVDWDSRRPDVAWVMSDTLKDADKNSDAVRGFGASPAKPYVNLEGEPYAGDAVRTAIWTFSTGGGHYFFHADAGQETVRTGIMGYDPHVPGGDKGTYKRDWLGYASRFFNNCLDNLDGMAPHNELSSSGSYCLAEPGREYVIYSTLGSPTALTVDLSTAAGKALDCRFYNPADGRFEPAFRRTGGGNVEQFAKPDERDWVLHIVAK